MSSAINSPLSAVVYGRFSTDKQDMQRQDHLLDTYCAAHSLTIVARFSDPDTSGSVPFAVRDGGRQLLAMLTPGLAVVTTEQDRIGRDTIDQISTIRLFWDCGITPHFAAEGGPLERTPENEMKMELRASIAQYERNKIRQRIKGKMSAKREAGELCGTVPYGFDAVETGAVTPHGVKVRRLTDNPVEQKWILFMHQLREKGMGYHSIAKRLNEEKAPTKRAGEILNLRTSTDEVQQKFATGKWQAGNVSKVLNNKTVKAWLETKAATAVAA